MIGIRFGVLQAPRISPAPSTAGCVSGFPAWMSRLFLAVALALQFGAVGYSQQDGVELSGTVRDPSGARIPHALVLISDADTGLTEVTVAGADGSFRIAGLAPSPSYQVEVRGPAEFDSHVQGLDLTVDQHLDLELGIVGIVEAIVISGARPVPESIRRDTPRRRIRVGGNVQKARLVNYVVPVYPPEAEREGVGGTVLLEAAIGTDGDPIGLTALNSIVDERLKAAAIEAVMQWRYKPTLLNGRPVEVVATISVAFEPT